MKEKTILMIDDDVEDQEIFIETLSEIDPLIKCFNFSNVRNALKALEEKIILPDLIFTDINMPLMDGYEFLKEIKKCNDLNHIPVIIYTTSSEVEHKQQSIKLGASSFLTKPSKILELKNNLETILSEHCMI